MPWSTIATNQCVSLNNLRDAIANGIFIAISSVPSGTKQITKTEALAYVDIQTSPLASKASNQLVVKNNLNAAVYTYNRFDVNTTTCGTSNPIQHWSYYDIPFGLYNINGTGSLYQLIAATHTNFTNQITSYNPTTCTPLTIYTYLRYDLNLSNCATSNPIQFWSYNNYANGNYTINGGGSIYSLQSSSHTNYTNQITSADGASCSGETLYYYNIYRINTCNCSQTFIAVVRSNNSYANGYYYVSTSQQDYVYLESTTPQSYYPAFYVISTAPPCTVSPCVTWYFNNSGDIGSPNETFYYAACGCGVPCTTLSTVVLAPGSAPASRCVSYGFVPYSDQGDNPWTYDETCC
jgi:hypothetical protein